MEVPDGLEARIHRRAVVDGVQIGHAEQDADGKLLSGVVPEHVGHVHEELVAVEVRPPPEGIRDVRLAVDPDNVVALLDDLVPVDLDGGLRALQSVLKRVDAGFGVGMGHDERVGLVLLGGDGAAFLGAGVDGDGDLGCRRFLGPRGPASRVGKGLDRRDLRGRGHDDVHAPCEGGLLHAGGVGDLRVVEGVPALRDVDQAGREGLRDHAPLPEHEVLVLGSQESEGVLDALFDDSIVGLGFLDVAFESFNLLLDVFNALERFGGGQDEYGLLLLHACRSKDGTRK